MKEMIRNTLRSILFMIIFSAVSLKAQPPVIATPSEPDFGPTPVYQLKYLLVELTNQTNALVYFLEPEMSSTVFSAYPQTWAIPSGGTVEMYVGFQPDSDTIFEGILSMNIYTAFGVDTLLIPLAGEGFILKPENLTASVNENMALLNWLPPGASPNLLSFGSGEPIGALGTSAGNYEFAQRFTTGDLMPYTGKQLSAVEFFITENDADFTLNIYTGEFAEFQVFSIGLVDPVPNEWNLVLLPDPLELSEPDYLWLAYETEQDNLGFIAGVDGGPGVSGSGDLIRINGSEWTTLADYGYSNNWCIRGLLTGEQTLQSAAEPSLPGNTDELQGYNLYRDGERLNGILVNALSYIDTIVEGESFEYGVTAVFSYGESHPAQVFVNLPLPINTPDGWEYSITNFAHNIHIPGDAVLPGINLSPGDAIGAFYEDNGMEKCAGAGLWNGEHLIVTSYGDDPATPEKEGFSVSESLRWKFFSNQSGNTYPLTATYDPGMPHSDGAFHAMGLSMLSSLGYDGTVNFNEYDHMPETLNIYPNPSSGKLHIKGLNHNDLFSIFDLNGRIVYSGTGMNSSIDLGFLNPGLYSLEVQSPGKVQRKKVILR